MRPRGYRLFVAGTVLFAGLGPTRAETTVVIVGSERMAPLLRELAEGYMNLHADTKIDVRSGGSDAGVKALMDEADVIASLSRPAGKEEIRKIRQRSGRDPVGVPVAMDAVALFVHPVNPLDSLTIDQINRIYDQTIDGWEELGVKVEPKFPSGDPARRRDEGRIRRHIPPPTSGSPSILEARAMPGKCIVAHCVEHESLRDVVHAVGQDRMGLGLGGAGYTHRIKMLGIKKDEYSPAVKPTPEAIQSREYPFAHYLYLYFPGRPTGAARDFMKFVISSEGQRVVSESKTGLVPLPMKAGKGE